MSHANEVVRAFLRDRGSPAVTSKASDKAEALAFEALAILADRHDRRQNRVTPVATTPRSALGARRSDAVLRELIRGANVELIVLGYEVSDIEIITALAQRASLGITVELLVDAVQTPVDTLVEAWPRGAGEARVWSTSRDDDGRRYRLHAKAVIADGRRAMIGSANLTYSGLHTNLELGVLIEGPVARRLRRHVTEMVHRGVVEPSAVLGAAESDSR